MAAAGAARGVVAVTEKNIGFNSALHATFRDALKEAEDGLRILQDSFISLYPKADRGPEARVRRNLWSALQGIREVRLAMKEIQEKEGER